MDGYEIERVELRRGLKVGEVWEREALVREASVGDVLEAHRATASSVESGIRMTLRRVVHIGSIKGPLTPEVARNLSAEDLRRLQQACSVIDARLSPAGEQEDADEDTTF